MIPKIIHQIWYQGVDAIPRDLVTNSKKIIEFHKTWDYVIWDDNKIKNHFKNNKKILNTYNKLDYLHQKVDFIRYCILYEMGGVYVDMDVTILKSFDKIIDTYNNYECIISDINLNTLESHLLCSNSKCLNNGIIFSQPKSKFMQSLINEIHKNYECVYYDLNKSMCINRTTGPLLFTKMFNRYSNKTNIKVLNWSYFEPCILGDLCDIKDNTVLIHHHNTTWISKFFTWIGYYYFKHKRYVALLFSLIIVMICCWSFRHITN